LASLAPWKNVVPWNNGENELEIQKGSSANASYMELKEPSPLSKLHI
jgi:hypothetical protein